MATIIVSRGRNVMQGRAFSTADGFAAIQSLSVDDYNGAGNAFQDSDEDLDRAGALTIPNFFAVNFDATPVLNTSTNEVTVEATVPAASGNFTHRRIGHHNATAGSVTRSSNTLVSGIDGQSIGKTADFDALYRDVYDLTDAS